MICRICIRRSASSLRPSTPASSIPSLPLPRHLHTTSSLFSPEPAATSASPSAAQPFSTPLSPPPNPTSVAKPAPKVPLPASSCPSGTILKGINYFKNKDDPVALKEEEYPEWLWRCLDVKKKGADGEGGKEEGDEFSKSKKLRRKAAKRQRKLEAALLASGETDHLIPKVPMTQQSIDLPSNEEGSLRGALEAGEVREELRRKMRTERKRKIKEGNYLKGM